MSGGLSHAGRCPHKDNSKQVLFSNTFLDISSFNDDSDVAFHFIKFNVLKKTISTATGRMGPFPLKI